MMKILVVDDHDVVREGLCRMLSGQPDMEVVGKAASGEAAMALLKDGLQANFVLTDMNMPGMDGLELIRQCTALRKGLPVVLLTLHAVLTIRGRAMAAGASDCVSKDGELDELLATMRAVQQARLANLPV